MRLLDRMERKFGGLAVPHLTAFVVAGQAVFFLALMAQPGSGEKLVLDREAIVAQREYHRLISFVFLPPNLSIIWILFALYLFFLMGTALENSWGTFRYNVYFFLTWLGSVIAVFIAPGGVGTNAFIATNILLAFAHLYPEFELLILFILPVKIKYLAWLTWIGLALTLIRGDWTLRAQIAASLASYFLFFGRSIAYRIKSGKRKLEFKAKVAAGKIEPFHRCRVCNVTERDDPKIDFRCCSKCNGSIEYCEAHIFEHEHVP